MIGLTYIMKLENVTGKELSERLGVSAAAISQWEKKVRPIPQSRIPILSMMFPAYPASLFAKELDEKDMFQLQEAKLNSLKELVSEEDIQFVGRYKKKRDADLKIGALVERDKLLKRISNFFEAIENLETNIANVTLFRSVLKVFSDFCSIEEKLVKNNINRNENNRIPKEEFLSDIKKLAQDLEYQIGSFEMLKK